MIKFCILIQFIIQILFTYFVLFFTLFYNLYLTTAGGGSILATGKSRFEVGST